MAEKQSFAYDGKTINIVGVVRVVQISEKECVFRLDGQTLAVKGDAQRGAP